MRGFTRWVLAVVVVLGGGCLQVINWEDARPGWLGGGPVGTCTDTIRNGKETGVDCGGGTCPACTDGEGCANGADCGSKVCSGGTCLPPACDDKQKNGEETDVDCGGSCAAKCSAEKGCEGDADCKSGQCAGGMCQATCTDGEEDGAETDVDCGGATSGCPMCADAQRCKVNGDCVSGICTAQTCESYYNWNVGFIAGTSMDTIHVSGLALDQAGNAAVTGHFSGTTSFGGVPLASAGGQDIFVATFDAAGNPLTSHRFGDAADQRVYAIASLANGVTAITGGFQGSLNFTGAPLVSTGSDDVFVAVLDPSGTPAWSARFGGLGSQLGSSIGFRPDSNIVVAGVFSGTINLGGTTLTSAGGQDIFVARFTGVSLQDWKHVWSKRFGGPGNEYVKMQLDASGNIILAGGTEGPLDLGGGALAEAGGADVFVAVLDPSGNHLWSKRFGDGGDQYVNDLAVDAAGNVIVNGSVRMGSIDLGGGPLVDLGNGVTFLAKLGASGKHVWSRAIDVDATRAARVSVDSVGNVVVGGTSSPGADFGGGPLSGGGYPDAAIAKYDGAGNFVWARLFGDNQDQGGGPIAAYDAKSVLVSGDFSGSVAFGKTPLVCANGGTSAFLARLHAP